MFFGGSLKEMQDDQVIRAIMYACMDSKDECIGGRYAQKKDKVIIAFQMKSGTFEKDGRHKNVADTLKDKLPSIYKEKFEIWDMSEFENKGKKILEYTGLVDMEDMNKNR